jgi:hypothetical protein
MSATLPPPVTQLDLDPMGCGTPDCGHDHSILFMHAQCHPKAGLEVAYHKALGALICRCNACKGEVSRVAVAAEPKSRIIRA